ncbi:Protein of unknown function DUF247, plant [Dillenia turbinata]|uniref:Uncharacterized protein n=1 Tax=Dillenia turbinata TaxID=194707 RepID=A0AAN8USC2_9MAGN
MSSASNQPITNQPSMKKLTSIQISNVKFDEERWARQIHRALQGNKKDYCGYYLCIYNVPRILMSSDPQSYIPHEVAIGPYHFWRPELYEMSWYKLSSARSTQDKLAKSNKSFHGLKTHLKEALELKFRASYHRYLELSGSTLGAMMAIDGSFLLEFLEICINLRSTESSNGSISSETSDLLKLTSRKSTFATILRDIVMLENQIPLFVLKEILIYQHSSPTSAADNSVVDHSDAKLHKMLKYLHEHLTPFTKSIYCSPEASTLTSTEHYNHLLDFLYATMTAGLDLSSRKDSDCPDIQYGKAEGGKVSYFGNISNTDLKNQAPDILKGLAGFMNGSATPMGPLLKGIAGSLGSIITYVPKLLGCSSQKTNHQNSSKYRPEDELRIPSVTELCKVNVNIVPATGGISTIKFEADKGALHLPCVTIDVNTGIVMRNLVAYEASFSEQLILARYIELMNGIVDTAKDAKKLKEKKIIMRNLKDDEVADLWNGMSKSIKLTHVEFLDKMIVEVNKYYDSRWKVRARRMMKRFLFDSWQVLLFLATLVFLALMVLQAFCSAYNCTRFYRTS